MKFRSRFILLSQLTKSVSAFFSKTCISHADHEANSGIQIPVIKGSVITRNNRWKDGLNFPKCSSSHWRKNKFRKRPSICSSYKSLSIMNENCSADLCGYLWNMFESHRHVSCIKRSMEALLFFTFLLLINHLRIHNIVFLLLIPSSLSSSFLCSLGIFVNNLSNLLCMRTE